MKPFYFFLTIFITLLGAPHSMAQVKLPLDASNCAIFNALNLDESYYCAQTFDLGQSRGLIVDLDETLTDHKRPVQPKVLTGDAVIIKRPKRARIDHKAAKSESGYYIHFAFDSERLEEEYREHLNKLAIVLNSPAMKENCVKITGHTDTVGNAKYNLKLSQRRAKSVLVYLTAQKKINQKRFTISAVGEAQPLPDKKGTSPFNRRVEFSSKPVSTGCNPKG
jgi:outer membrane protein OmpA-like peptidoglycan-associated protein